MKNMLFIGGVFTLAFTVFLVWMDNSLANYMECHQQPVNRMPLKPRFEETLYDIPAVKKNGNIPQDTIAHRQRAVIIRPGNKA